MEANCRADVNQNLEAKIVILGEQNVGKTSFVVVFNPNGLHEEETKSQLKKVTPTIGASFVTCRVRIKDKSVKMQIWDTAGQERFRSMAPLYYRKANAAVVMYDICVENSFRAAKLWVVELKRNIEAPVLILLVGNKADLSDQRAVPYEEGRKYANSVGALFCETSAATDKGVCEAFSLLARSLIAYEEEHSNFQYKYKTSDYYVQLHKNEPPPGSSTNGDEFSNCCST